MCRIAPCALGTSLRSGRSSAGVTTVRTTLSSPLEHHGIHSLLHSPATRMGSRRQRRNTPIRRHRQTRSRRWMLELLRPQPTSRRRSKAAAKRPSCLCARTLPLNTIDQATHATSESHDSSDSHLAPYRLEAITPSPVSREMSLFSDELGRRVQPRPRSARRTIGRPTSLAEAGASSNSPQLLPTDRNVQERTLSQE